MSATGLDVFDKTVQTTNIWLDEIMARMGPDRHIAWHILGAVLRALRDRLPLDDAAHLGAQLPLLVRGLYYDQWHSPSAILGDRSLASKTQTSFLLPPSSPVLCASVFCRLFWRANAPTCGNSRRTCARRHTFGCSEKSSVAYAARPSRANRAAMHGLLVALSEPDVCIRHVSSGDSHDE